MGILSRIGDHFLEMVSPGTVTSSRELFRRCQEDVEWSIVQGVLHETKAIDEAAEPQGFQQGK